MIKLSVSFDKGVEPFGQAAMQRVVNQIDKTLTADKTKPLVVNVRVADKKVVQQLNRRYSGKNEPTDVLSFNYADPERSFASNGAGGPPIQKEGDIVISYPHIQAQAALAGTSIDNELALLVTHGILHLLGHDHPTPAKRAEFDQLQKKIMTAAELTYRPFGWQDYSS